MGRKIVLFSIVLTAVLFCFSFALSQRAKEEKGQARTITLASGEVIYDLNGEWAVCAVNYGPWERFGTYPGLIEIRQEGAIFEGIRLISLSYAPKGSVAIVGELDETGIKKIQIMSGLGPVDCKGEILSSGNKMIIEDGEKVKAIFIRR